MTFDRALLVKILDHESSQEYPAATKVYLNCALDLDLAWVKFDQSTLLAFYIYNAQSSGNLTRLIGALGTYECFRLPTDAPWGQTREDEPDRILYVSLIKLIAKSLAEPVATL